MRSKALVLGALASPFEGPWVDITGAENWRCRVETIPGTADLGVRVRLDVELSDGFVVALCPNYPVSGRRVRFVIEDEIPGVKTLSAFIDEVK